MVRRYDELRGIDSLPDQALRRLVLVKQAMREVTVTIQRASKAKATTTDDKLGWTMRFLRAMEDVRLNTASVCVRAYPRLRELANPDNPNARLQSGLAAVRQHAIELAKSSIHDNFICFKTRAR